MAPPRRRRAPPRSTPRNGAWSTCQRSANCDAWVAPPWSCCVDGHDSSNHAISLRYNPHSPKEIACPPTLSIIVPAAVAAPAAPGQSSVSRWCCSLGDLRRRRRVGRPAGARDADRTPARRARRRHAWKNIGGPVLSPDGRWLAYRWGAEFAPGEVVARATGSENEWRFTGGEQPRTPVGAGRPSEQGPALSFSKDSRFMAWVVFPDRDPAAAKPGSDAGPDPARKKANERRLGIVEIATGKFVTIEAVASYAFAGDRADWIAIHKSGDEKGEAHGAGTGRRHGPAGPDAEGRAPGQRAPISCCAGSRTADLVIGHVTEYGFDESGRFLAWASHPDDETGAGVTCATSRPAWCASSPAAAITTGPALARAWRRARLPRRTSRRRLEAGPLHAVGLLRLRRGRAARGALGSGVRASFPAAMGIHPSERPYWLEDRSAIVFGLRRLEVAEKDAVASKDDWMRVTRRATTRRPTRRPPTRRTRRNRRTTSPRPPVSSSGTGSTNDSPRSSASRSSVTATARSSPSCAFPSARSRGSPTTIFPRSRSARTTASPSASIAVATSSTARSTVAAFRTCGRSTHAPASASWSPRSCAGSSAPTRRAIASSSIAIARSGATTWRRARRAI